MSAPLTVLLAGKMSLSQADGVRQALQTEWLVEAVDPAATHQQFSEPMQWFAARCRIFQPPGG